MKERDFVEKIKITSEYITLGQLLKLTRLAYSGGIVKAFLEEHKISVNDVEDKRRGKKLYPGDKVSIKSVGEYRIVK
jgi:ribosome-associated protein